MTVRISYSPMTNDFADLTVDFLFCSYFKINCRFCSDLTSGPTRE